jgi:hypothetical protein
MNAGRISFDPDSFHSRLVLREINRGKTDNK